MHQCNSVCARAPLCLCVFVHTGPENQDNAVKEFDSF